MGSNAAISARLPDVSGVLSERRARASLWTWVVLLLVLTAAAELHGSWLQSSLASWIGRQLAYELLPGSSPTIRYPTAGPYDRRLGYSELPA